jgi:hypothetical protein
MASDLMVMESIAQSPRLSGHEKSKLAHWWEQATGMTHKGAHSLSKARHAASQHVTGAGHAVRLGGEMALAGAALGALRAKGHLDIKGKVPVDGLLALGGLALGTVMADNEYSQDLRNVGGAALAIYAFRKTDEFVVKKSGARVAAAAPAAASPHAGEVGFGAEDPIITAARRL